MMRFWRRRRQNQSPREARIRHEAVEYVPREASPRRARIIPREAREQYVPREAVTSRDTYHFVMKRRDKYVSREVAATSRGTCSRQSRGIIRSPRGDSLAGYVSHKVRYECVPCEVILNHLAGHVSVQYVPREALRLEPRGHVSLAGRAGSRGARIGAILRQKLIAIRVLPTRVPFHPNP